MERVKRYDNNNGTLGEPSSSSSTENSNNMDKFYNFTIDQKDGFYSDEVDEDVEARLYSFIHHSSTPEITKTEKRSQNFLENETGKRRDRKRQRKDKFEEARRERDLVEEEEEETIDLVGEDSDDDDDDDVRIIEDDDDDENDDENDEEDDDDDDDDDDEGLKDIWHIDYKDILISNPVHGQYYRPRIYCTRCRRKGNHPVRLCHLPKHKICYICGNIGHLGHHCRNQHCTRCMDFHPTSQCTGNVREIQCRICQRNGHLEVNCPNHWRRLYNITDPRINPDHCKSPIQRNERKSCSNCGRTQHFTFECDNLRHRPIQPCSPYDTKTTVNYNSSFPYERGLPTLDPRNQTSSSHSSRTSNNFNPSFPASRYSPEEDTPIGPTPHKKSKQGSRYFNTDWETMEREKIARLNWQQDGMTKGPKKTKKAYNKARKASNQQQLSNDFAESDDNRIRGKNGKVSKKKKTPRGKSGRRGGNTGQTPNSLGRFNNGPGPNSFGRINLSGFLVGCRR